MLNNIEPSEIFKCIMCGNCCKGYGGTYVSTKDSKIIASFLKIPHGKFISCYTKSSGSKTILSQQKNGFCVFWHKKRACLIHPVKPRMCKQWPFINSILIDVNNWKIMAHSCPGMKPNTNDTQITACVENWIEINKNANID